VTSYTQDSIPSVGLGLRPEHFQDFIASKQPVDWLEVLTDNYLVPGGKPLYFLDRIRQDYPVAMHGVAMNLGSLDPLDFDYLHQVRELSHRIDPFIISDHLCWTGFNHRRLYDLLPLPYTEEAIQHVAERIMRVQDFLGRRLTIENLSAYLEATSPMTEWAFVRDVARTADCDLLVDINNIYVSSRNQGFDPSNYLRGLDPLRVRQFHLAGHTDFGNHCIDTHDHPVCDAVWDLYAEAVHLFGPIPTLLERDDQIPELDVLLLEVQKARDIAAHILVDGTLETGESRPLGVTV
jgi:uncharacterized protein (UPF0276 family)